MTAFPRKQPPVDFTTQYSLSFTAQEDEIVVDFFCGGGGAGTDLEMGLGRPVAVAKNHSAKAISMQTANHTAARPFTTDVFDGDPDIERSRHRVGRFDMLSDAPTAARQPATSNQQPATTRRITRSENSPRSARNGRARSH